MALSDKIKRLIDLSYTLEDVEIEAKTFFSEEVYYDRVTDTFWAIQNKEYEDSDISEIVEISDERRFYVLHFYNGGCSFNEALEEAVEKNRRKKNEEMEN